MTFPVKGTILSRYIILVIAISLITLNVGHLCAGEKEGLQRFEETGFFLMITLAEGYTVEKAFPNDSVIEPLNPSKDFKEGTPEVYSIFHFRPNMTGFELWVRVVVDTAEDFSAEKEIGWEAVAVIAGENSAFIKLPSPSLGWSKGEYLAEFFVNAPVTMNLERVIRFTVFSPE
jgi:hypothetical protein